MGTMINDGEPYPTNPNPAEPNDKHPAGGMTDVFKGAKPEPSQKIAKVLDDAFEMGVNHGKGLWNDYPTLKKEMVKALLDIVKEARQEGVERGAQIANEEWLKFADHTIKGIKALQSQEAMDE